jgi:hypothetical protein
MCDTIVVHSSPFRPEEEGMIAHAPEGNILDEIVTRILRQIDTTAFRVFPVLDKQTAVFRAEILNLQISYLGSTQTSVTALPMPLRRTVKGDLRRMGWEGPYTSVGGWGEAVRRCAWAGSREKVRTAPSANVSRERTLMGFSSFQDAWQSGQDA